MISRLAKLSDVPGITIIHKELFPGEMANSHNQIRSEYHRVYVTTDSHDTILGYVIYQVIDGEAEIYFFGVKEEFQSQKIGQGLFNFSIEELKKEGINKITLEVKESNLAARKIYEKFGFINVGVRPRYYHNEDGIIYVWEDKTI